MVAEFGEVVPSELLLRAAWPHKAASSGALRVHLTRLRKEIAPLGLEILAVRSYGYVLQDGPAEVGTS